MKITSILIGMSLLVSVISCKKEQGPAGTNGQPGPKLTGTLGGFVTCFDKYGRQIPDMNNVEVILEGTSKKAYTNANGSWLIDSVETGTYNLTFNKAGYGTHKLQSIPFVGGNTTFVRNAQLGKIPDFKVQELSLKDTTIQGSKYILFRGKLNTTDTKTRTVAFFVGDKDDVSASPEHYLLPFSRPSDTGAFAFVIPLDDIQAVGFPTGSTMYVAAYGATANYTTVSYYQDFYYGRAGYNALSYDALTTSVKIP